jgi:hypothetical protein
MKELSEIEKEFNDGLIKVQTELGNTMVGIGVDALGMIKKRVTETGLDAKGQGFPPYSTGTDFNIKNTKTKEEKTVKGMLVGCKSFRSKDCNKFFGKQKNKEHEWVTIKRGDDLYRLAVLEGGYKKLREISLGAGKGDKVDFSFTNDMWNDIHLISTSSDHNSGTVIIGALKKEEKDKLYYNTERNKKKGGQEILDLSESEINYLKEEFMQPILNIFK